MPDTKQCPNCGSLRPILHDCPAPSTPDKDAPICPVCETEGGGHADYDPRWEGDRCPGAPDKEARVSYRDVLNLIEDLEAEGWSEAAHSTRLRLQPVAPAQPPHTAQEEARVHDLRCARCCQLLPDDLADRDALADPNILCGPACSFQQFVESARRDGFSGDHLYDPAHGSDFPLSVERGCGASGKEGAHDTLGQPAREDLEILSEFVAIAGKPPSVGRETHLWAGISVGEVAALRRVLNALEPAPETSESEQAAMVAKPSGEGHASRPGPNAAQGRSDAPASVHTAQEGARGDLIERLDFIANRLAEGRLVEGPLREATIREAASLIDQYEAALARAEAERDELAERSTALIQGPAKQFPEVRDLCKQMGFPARTATQEGDR
jgi:hypothetical protein